METNGTATMPVAPERGVMKGIAIGGFGAIGRVVARRLDQGVDGVTLTAVSARDAARAEAAMADFIRPVPVAPLARLWESLRWKSGAFMTDLTVSKRLST